MPELFMNEFYDNKKSPMTDPKGLSVFTLNLIELHLDISTSSDFPCLASYLQTQTTLRSLSLQLLQPIAQGLPNAKNYEMIKKLEHIKLKNQE